MQNFIIRQRIIFRIQETLQQSGKHWRQLYDIISLLQQPGIGIKVHTFFQPISMWTALATNNHRNFLFYHDVLFLNKKTIINPIHIPPHKEQENTRNNQGNHQSHLLPGKNRPPRMIKVSGHPNLTSASYIINGQTIRFGQIRRIGRISIRLAFLPV